MAAARHEAKGFRFPLLQGVLPLNRSQAPADIMAGITLAALNIPQAMGYTKIAGTPVITGLYVILIPPLLFAFFGSSRHLVVGADSATAAILAAGLAGLAARGSSEYTALCGLLAIMAATLLFLARFIGLGFLADFLSRTVLIGFLTGVGVQVSLLQIGGMLGLPQDGGIDPLDRLYHDIQHFPQTNVPTLGVTVAVLAVILGSRKISQRFPGALLAVIGAIVVSWAIDLKALGVKTLGAVPRGLPEFGWPHIALDTDLVARLIPMAVSIFVVIMAQSAATSRAYASRYREHLNENMDLVGLGLANIGAGLTGAFVVNGSPTATEMVDSAGGRCQLAQIVSSMVVLMVLLFLTGPLAYMPDAALSAVVFLICVHLIDIKGMQNIYRERPAEFWVALITAATVVLVGVMQGIILAMFLSLVSHTRHGYRPKNAVMVPAKSEGWKSQPVTTQAQFLPGLLVYRFNHGMYYANAEILSAEVTRLVREAQPPLKWFCIDAAAVDDVDFTATEVLRSLYDLLRKLGVKLIFSEVSDQVFAQLKRSGITDLLGQDAFYQTTGAVVRDYRKKVGMPA
uniref:SulP family inorganic anion transporter n=1 Tax=Desulfobacca acetoxidans TaxID=60893 RepID=A0A7V6A5T9_9BACT